MNKLFLVGLGPGDPQGMTEAARAALEQAEVLCGYTVYLDLVKEQFPEKETYTTPMTRELERCQWAVNRAAQGKNVEIEVVPGVTAAISGAAVLGAPLMHDFCVISLSDLLTPWETIARRLRCAAAGDFSIVLYNPRSKKRPEHLRRACQILLEEKSPDTVCGWVRNIGRAGQTHGVVTLGELGRMELDMFTTVFIGASSTKVIDGRMVTPRGYRT